MASLIAFTVHRLHQDHSIYLVYIKLQWYEHTRGKLPGMINVLKPTQRIVIHFIHTISLYNADISGLYGGWIKCWGYLAEQVL